MPALEKKKYRNNFLSQVICQVTFPAYDGFTEEALKDYKSALGTAYGELASVKQQGIVIENTGSEIKSQTEDSLLWQIESSDKSHIITITRDSFAVVHTKYTKFRDYITVIESVQGVFFQKFDDITQINRLGLRYINQIVVDQLSNGWSEYITDHLVGSLSFVDYSSLRRSMHTMMFQHDDRTKVTFNYGVFNEYFPAPIQKNEFILDIDAFSDNIESYDECLGLINNFNTAIAVCFEKSITDELRRLMEVIEDGTGE